MSTCRGYCRGTLTDTLRRIEARAAEYVPSLPVLIRAADLYARGMDGQAAIYHDFEGLMQLYCDTANDSEERCAEVREALRRRAL